MSDQVTCIAVLKKSPDRTRPDSLTLCAGEGKWYKTMRTLPCAPKGAHIAEGKPWEYVENEGMLTLTPSMLCLESGFHTDFQWNVKYAPCPEGVDASDYYFAVNPDEPRQD